MFHTRTRVAPLILVLAVAGMATATVAAATPTLVWTDQHDGGGSYVDDGYCLLTDPEGNLVVGGESSDLLGGIDLYLRKLDKTDGHQLWENSYRGYDDKDVAISEMTWDTVGQLLVAGFIRGCVG